MKHFFQQVLYLSLFISALIFGSEPKEPTLTCTICTERLNGDYSVDAWGNPFHSHHEKEGRFCHSCSRIISQSITAGGFKFTDGRFLCSLCKSSMIESNVEIQGAYLSVLQQLAKINIDYISDSIPIQLVNQNQLRELTHQQFNYHLKGFTQFIESEDTVSTQIYILYGLPEIEFQASLAHELLHVYLYHNNILLGTFNTEGFCNLGSALIYNNDGTQFSQIHLQAMVNNPDEAYGTAFLNFQKEVEKNGWEYFLNNLTH